MNSKLQNRIFKKCVNDFSLSNCRTLHFSFIIYKNKIISFGWNNARKSHPIAKIYGHRYHCIHAELHAINNLYRRDIRLDKIKLANVRIFKDGSFGISKPCDVCCKLLLDLNINDIWYTNEHGNFIKMPIANIR